MTNDYEMTNLFIAYISRKTKAGPNDHCTQSPVQVRPDVLGIVMPTLAISHQPAPFDLAKLGKTTFDRCINVPAKLVSNLTLRHLL
jgi:hypothetical protein